MKTKSYLLILIIVLVLAALIWGAIYLFIPSRTNNPPNNEPPKRTEIVSDNANISVYDLKEGQEVSFPFTINGRARVFENVVNVEIKDKTTGKVIFTANPYADAPDVGLYGDFSETVNFLYSLPQSSDMVLNVFWASPKDGSPLDLISIPLKINSVGAKSIKVFFNNSKFDPEVSCNEVFGVDRIIPNTQSLAKTAIEILLNGPSSSELDSGYSTSINFGSKLKSISIDNAGLARADFDEQLEFQVGGSCRVSAIRSQIVQTLKQFSTVKDVLISINGRTEDILQP